MADEQDVEWSSGVQEARISGLSRAPTAISGTSASEPLEHLYRLEGVLGEGSTGRVYRARAVDGGYRVAVKRLTRRRGDAVVHSHLLAEVAALGGIAHPNVVRLLDRGEDAQGPWLVTELVEGASLRQLLGITGALTLLEAVQVLQGALAGLGALHAHALVHGDVKPENIVVDASSGRSKLIDVGVPGMGSPGYQAPEVLDGRCPDARSDIYAMGVVLFETLCGQPPCPVGCTDPLRRVDGTNVVPGMHPAVAHLLQSALARDPAHRPTSAEALQAALDAAAVQVGRRVRRSRALTVALSAVAGAGSTAFGWIDSAGMGSSEHHGGATAIAPTTPNGRALRMVRAVPIGRMVRTGRVLHGVRVLAGHKIAAVAVLTMISLTLSGARPPLRTASDGYGIAGVATNPMVSSRTGRSSRHLTLPTGFALQ